MCYSCSSEDGSIGCYRCQEYFCGDCIEWVHMKDHKADAYVCNKCASENQHH